MNELAHPMLWIGGFLLGIGGLVSAFKGYVIWNVAHDAMNGGGVPTLDFVLIWPIPLALGGRLLLAGLDAVPFPGFGFVLYIAVASAFGVLTEWFNRLGMPERRRQCAAMRERIAVERKDT